MGERIFDKRDGRNEVLLDKGGYLGAGAAICQIGGEIAFAIV